MKGEKGIVQDVEELPRAVNLILSNLIFTERAKFQHRFPRIRLQVVALLTSNGNPMNYQCCSDTERLVLDDQKTGFLPQVASIELTRCTQPERGESLETRHSTPRPNRDREV